MTEPTRLMQDVETAAALRRDLERVQGVTPRVYDAAAGLQRLNVALAASQAGATVGAKAWTWIGAATLVTAVGVGVVANRPSAPAHVQPSVAATSPAPAVPVAAPPALVPAALPEPVVVEAPATVPAHALDPDAQLRAETAHLARARAALERSPEQALRLAEQGEQRFARGMFSQERQSIIVLSALLLSRPGAADEARQFLSAHPHSPLSERIRQALASHPSP
jgi:hypothetical protein